MVQTNLPVLDPRLKIYMHKIKSLTSHINAFIHSSQLTENSSFRLIWFWEWEETKAFLKRWDVLCLSKSGHMTDTVRDCWWEEEEGWEIVFVFSCVHYGMPSIPPSVAWKQLFPLPWKQEKCWILKKMTYSYTSVDIYSGCVCFPYSWEQTFSGAKKLSRQNLLTDGDGFPQGALSCFDSQSIPSHPEESEMFSCHHDAWWKQKPPAETEYNLYSGL